MKTIITEMKCPKCGNKIECMDTIGLSYIAFCDKCGWNSPKDYYKNNGKAELMTKEEALKKGLLYVCPDCGESMEQWEFKKYKRCMFCQVDRNLPL